MAIPKSAIMGNGVTMMLFITTIFPVLRSCGQLHKVATISVITQHNFTVVRLITWWQEAISMQDAEKYCAYLTLNMYLCIYMQFGCLLYNYDHWLLLLPRNLSWNMPNISFIVETTKVPRILQLSCIFPSLEVSPLTEGSRFLSPTRLLSPCN